MPNDNDDPVPGGKSRKPSKLDRGLAQAFGASDSDPAESPSVLGRLAKLIGSKPSVSLPHPDDSAPTPMLKPLGSDVAQAAGKYVVQGELGRGGVGAVHRGHDQDLGRDVAMKFLHDRYKDEPSILHRFVEEAQIGGQLQHPGIVPVYDLGMSDGRPFFAMKLVKGKTLAQTLAERDTQTNDRRQLLSVFEQICQTMAYAHVRGVVHRDLKPANVMIGSFGEVQVVDWGMGKVIARGGVADEARAAAKHSAASIIETVRSAGHGTQSVMGSVMGTPAYMPPEQARGDVEAMDERSDVFALGAILCEILTGLPPYVGAPEDLIAMAAMARLDDAHARLASCGAEDVLIELAKQCMMPAPGARPRTAQAVAKAVHDHLVNLEERVHAARVEAAEAKVRTTALKRQQRLGLALLLTVAVGLGASLWFWDDARDQQALAETAAVTAGEQRDEADKQRKLAIARAEDLARVAEFQSNQLTRIVPELMGADLRDAIVTAVPATERTRVEAAFDDVNFTNIGVQSIRSHVLDPALAAIDEQFENRPRLAASLLLPLSETLASLGQLAPALELRQRELAILREHAGENDLATIESMRRSGALLRDLGELEEGRKLLEEAVAAAGTPSTSERPDIALDERQALFQSAQQSLAVALDSQGQHIAAKRIYEQCLTASRAQFGDQHASTLLIRANLGRLAAKMGDANRSETILRDVLEEQRRVLGEDHRDTVMSISALAAALRKLGKYSEAAVHSAEALQRFRQARGDRHPTTTGSMINHANNLVKLGRAVEAEALHNEALATLRESLGVSHELTRETLNGLAASLAEQGKFAAAESHYRTILTSEAVRARPRIGLPATHSLCQVLLAQSKHDDAEAVAEQMLATATEAGDESGEFVFLARRSIGDVSVRKGQLAQGVEHLRAALSGLRDSAGDRDPETLTTMQSLADALNRMGRRKQADAVLREALDLHREVFGPTDRHTLRCQVDLSINLSTRELQEAFDLIDSALVHIRASLDAHDRLTLKALHQRGYCLKAMGKFEAAERDYRETIVGRIAVYGESAPQTLLARSNLATTLMRAGKHDETVALYRAILPSLRQTKGSDSAQVRLALNNLGHCLQELGSHAEAEPFLREAVAAHRARRDQPRMFQTTLWNLIIGLNKLKKFAELLPIARELATVSRFLDGPRAKSTNVAKSYIGGALLETGQPESAIEVLREIHDHAETEHDGDHPTTILSRYRLATALLRTGQWEAAESLLTKAQTAAERAGLELHNRKSIELLVELFTARHDAEPGAGHDATRDAWQRRLREL